VQSPAEPAVAGAPASVEVEVAVNAAQAEAAARAADAAARADAQVAEAAARLGRATASNPAAVVPPRTAREVEGLKVRRQMLAEQLEGAENQRQELTQSLQRVGDTEEGRSPDPAAVSLTRAGLEVRLKDVDARIIQLERDIAGTNRALTQASPEVLAAYEQQRPREPVHHGPDEGDVVGGVFGGALLGMVLLTAGRRIRAWRRRRRGQPAYDSVPAGVGPDPRIDRLTQAVDAIAVEVERIGEGQRFVTQLMAERRELIPAEAVRTADVPGMR
jgi:hypothetical protein